MSQKRRRERGWGCDSYNIVFDEVCIRFLERMPKPIRKRIYGKIISAKKDPFFFFNRLKGRKDYSMRVGDYRVIADIDASSKKINVTLIGHRKDVYG